MGENYLSGDVPANHPMVRLLGYRVQTDGRASIAKHRIVLFEKIGPGPHQCHWCGQDVAWTKGNVVGALVCDHLNGLKRDNRPDNLVPSCIGCNSVRGRIATPKISAEEVAYTWRSGRSRAVERTCEHCGKTYAGRPTVTSRFCSRACVTDASRAVIEGIRVSGDQRSCEHCGAVFFAKKSVRTRFCSGSCGATARWARVRANREHQS